MKIGKARQLLAVDITALTLEQLQRHKVKLLDAWRESKGDYGMKQAVEDGFFKVIGSESASGYSPTDIWLTHSLNQRIDDVLAREAFLIGGGDRK